MNIANLVRLLSWKHYLWSFASLPLPSVRCVTPSACFPRGATNRRTCINAHTLHARRPAAAHILNIHSEPLLILSITTIHHTSFILSSCLSLPRVIMQYMRILNRSIKQFEYNYELHHGQICDNLEKIYIH